MHWQRTNAIVITGSLCLDIATITEAVAAELKIIGKKPKVINSIRDVLLPGRHRCNFEAVKELKDAYLKHRSEVANALRNDDPVICEGGPGDLAACFPDQWSGALAEIPWNLHGRPMGRSWMDGYETFFVKIPPDAPLSEEQLQIAYRIESMMLTVWKPKPERVVSFTKDVHQWIALNIIHERGYLRQTKS